VGKERYPSGSEELDRHLRGGVPNISTKDCPKKNPYLPACESAPRKCAGDKAGARNQHRFGRTQRGLTRGPGSRAEKEKRD